VTRVQGIVASGSAEVVGGSLLLSAPLGSASPVRRASSQDSMASRREE